MNSCFVFWNGLAALCALALLMPLAASARAEETITAEQAARCRQVLLDGLKSDEFWPAMHAAEALTLAGMGADVVDLLEEKLAAESDDQRRCGLARELVRAGRKVHTAVLFEVLAKKDPYGHTHAAESLFKLGELGDGRAMRSAFANWDNKIARIMAAAALGRGGSREAMEFLRQMLANDQEDVRLIAGWVLGQIGGSEDIPQLRENASRATKPLSRAYHEHALAVLGDEAGRAALLRNLSSKDAAVRTYAANFAGDARMMNAAPALLKLLDDETLDVRVRAAQALLTLKHAPAPPAQGSLHP